MLYFVAKVKAVVDRFNAVSRAIPVGKEYGGPEWKAWSDENAAAYQAVAALGKEAASILAEEDKDGATAAADDAILATADSGKIWTGPADVSGVRQCDDCGGLVTSGAEYKNGTFLCHACNGGIPTVEAVDFRGRPVSAHSS